MLNGLMLEALKYVTLLPLFLTMARRQTIVESVANNKPNKKLAVKMIAGKLPTTLRIFFFQLCWQSLQAQKHVMPLGLKLFLHCMLHASC